MKNLPSKRASRLIRARSRARRSKPRISSIHLDDTFADDRQLAIFRRNREIGESILAPTYRLHPDVPMLSPHTRPKEASTRDRASGSLAPVARLSLAQSHLEGSCIEDRTIKEST